MKAWTLLLAATAVVWCAGPASAQLLDATCVASITLNFDPPARLVLPPTPAPHATATGGGTITNCVVTDGGPTTGTFTFSLDGNLTCTSTENIVGISVDIVWADMLRPSYADITTLALNLSGSLGGAAGLSRHRHPADVSPATSFQIVQHSRSPGLAPLPAERPVAGDPGPRASPSHHRFERGFYSDVR